MPTEWNTIRWCTHTFPLSPDIILTSSAPMRAPCMWPRRFFQRNSTFEMFPEISVSIKFKYVLPGLKVPLPKEKHRSDALCSLQMMGRSGGKLQFRQKGRWAVGCYESWSFEYYNYNFITFFFFFQELPIRDVRQNFSLEHVLEECSLGSAQGSWCRCSRRSKAFSSGSRGSCLRSRNTEFRPLCWLVMQGCSKVFYEVLGS